MSVVMIRQLALCIILSVTIFPVVIVAFTSKSPVSLTCLSTAGKKYNYCKYPCAESFGTKLYKKDDRFRTNWSHYSPNRSSASGITTNMVPNNVVDGTETSRTFAPFTEEKNAAITEDTQFSEADLLEQMTEYKNLMEDTNPSQTIPSPLVSAPEIRLQTVMTDYPAKTPFVTFTDTYKQLTSEHYLTMAFFQAGILASGADMATQTMACADPMSFGHVAAMATVASTMSGFMNAIWLRKLEEVFPGTETKEVAAKTLIHAIIIASIINSAYLVGVPFLNTFLYPDGLASAHMPPMDPTIIFAGWNLDEFITLTKLEILMFIPYNTLAFKYVPPQIRPLTHAAISATFNVAVSAVTLGYFNTWCEQANHVISTLGTKIY